jgi:SAM-dependent methyltransferase
LDLGCGAGKFTFELERFGARATGLDCSKEAVHLAREIAAAIGSSAEFHLGVFENMPFPKSSFDFVIFPQNIIEWSYDEMDRIACQVGNILAPGGKFCLEMRDALEHIGGTEGVKGSFDVITGTRQNQIYVPDEGEFPYEVTFWTVSFARFVVSRYLNFSGIEREDDNLYVLLFEKPIDKMTTNS